MAETFYQSGGGLAKELAIAPGRKGEKAPENLAIGYLLCVPSLYENGPRLWLSFSMGGTETLWFCHLLVEELAYLCLDVLESNRMQFWIVPFTCPDYTSVPTLSSDACVHRNSVMEVTWNR